MNYGIFDFNKPVASFIKDGNLHVFSTDEFVGNDTSSIGNTVIGYDTKNQTIDAIATVVGCYVDCEFQRDDTTVLQLEVTRLDTPITLPPNILRKLMNAFDRVWFLGYPLKIWPISKSLGSTMLEMANPNFEQEANKRPSMAHTHKYLAEIREVLRNESLSAEEKLELALARDGHGKFGDAVWSRDIGLRFDLEEIMDPERRVAHIRPWHASTDKQRIDPDNGLLLPSDFADAFENGYVTFDEDGNAVVSEYMATRIWNLGGSTDGFCSTLELNRGQHLYMHHHRQMVFEHWLRKSA